jgi:DNA polymerase-3 subunit delta'
MNASAAVDEFYPWHREVWDRIQAAKRNGRLPHALLLTGAEGMGKHDFAVKLAESLLCKHPDDQGVPCGQCRGCNLLRAGTHPDNTRIEPEEPGKAIRIDAIREFTAKESLTAQAGGYKVVVIEPADALNIAAANSLLKTLEEPVPWTIMILVTSNPGRLPATIRSRCQVIHFKQPRRPVIEQWLKQRLPQSDSALLLDLASGSPLNAAALAGEGILEERDRMLQEFEHIFRRKADPVAVAARWDKLDLGRSLNWFSGWIIDMLRLRSGAENTNLINTDQSKRLHALASRIELKQLYALLDQVYEAVRLSSTQVNSLLLLENLLLLWADANKG